LRPNGFIIGATADVLARLFTPGAERKRHAELSMV
jgi:hypothetical protein